MAGSASEEPPSCVDHGGAVDGVRDRLAHLRVVERLHLRVEGDVIGVAEVAGADAGGELLVAGDLGELGRAQVGVGGDGGRVGTLRCGEALVDDGGVEPGAHVDPVGVGLALLVGRGRPVRVAFQDEALAVALVLDDLVRPRGDRVLLVLGALVLGLRHRGRLGLRGQEGEFTLRLVEVEDDRLRVGRLDRVEALLVLVGALVVGPADQPVAQVGRTAGELGGEGALDAVLDVGTRDRGAVLVLQAVLEGVRPHGGVLTGRAQVGRQVGDDLRARCAVLPVAGGERTEDEGRDVAAAGGVEPGGVEVLLRLAVEDSERAALLGRARCAGIAVAVLAVLGPAGRGTRDHDEYYGGRCHAARYDGRLTHRKVTSRSTA